MSSPCPGAGSRLSLSLGALAALALPAAAQNDPAEGVPAPVRAPEAVAQEAVETVRGEPLPLEAIGPSFVEDMAAVIERQKALGVDYRNDPKSRNGAQGTWNVPSKGSSGAAHSGSKYATNKWGDTRMGIGFGEAVELSGLWVGGHQNEGNWARGVRVHGYLDGQLVASTEWLDSLRADYQWLAVGMDAVDRIEIEARPAYRGMGWYAIDDLTFERGDAEVVVDFEDLPNRAKLTGSGYRGLTWETGTGDFGQGAQDVHAPMTPGDEAAATPPAESEVEGTQGVGPGISPPTLLSDFRGIIRGDAGQFSYPPDTCGAIGPNHFVVAVNLTVGIYDRNTGLNQLVVGLSSFFNTGSFIGDPRVHYDQFEDRWIMIASGFSGDPRIFFAYSLTSDPNGAWFKSVFQVAQGSDSGCWPDYPTLGYDQDGIYTGIFMVGCGMSFFSIDKAPLLTGTPGFGTISAIRGLGFEGALQPCATYGDSGGVYVLSFPGSGSNLRVRQLNGPIATPSFTITNLSVNFAATAPDAPAMGSGTPLDTVDTRLFNAVYRDGAIWTAHTVLDGAGAAARWYEVDTSGPSPTLAQQGTVTDPNLWYYFPSICVNQNGDVVMGFTGSDANTFASAYYTGRKATDPPGQMAPPVLYKAGLAPQNNLDGFGRNRWGDYSLCTLDPQDETRIWTIQEYAQADDIWGTWIAELDPGPPLPETYCQGKLNSLFCLPFLSFNGFGSASSTAAFRIDGNDVVPNEFGILLYGTNGRSNLNFHNGTLCVKAPLTRVLPPKNSGTSGGGLCSGLLRRNFNATIQNGSDPVLTAGQTVNTQWLYRDPGVDSFNDGLTDGLEFQIQP